MERFILAAGLTLAGFLVAPIFGAPTPVAPILAAPNAAQQAAPAGNAVAGKRIFISEGCYECHGTTGAGGGYSGPSLAPNPLPFAAIKAQLRRPASRMPAYSDRVISDAQIADIAAYLQSIPTGKPASQIPILNQ